MKAFATLAFAAATLVVGACDRHEWDDVKDDNGNVIQKGTKRLFEAHGHDEDKGDKEAAK